jgi:hypothetical protein
VRARRHQLEELAPVAHQQRDRVARAQTRRAQRVDGAVDARIQIAPRGRAVLVDQRGRVAVAFGVRGEQLGHRASSGRARITRASVGAGLASSAGTCCNRAPFIPDPRRTPA